MLSSDLDHRDRQISGYSAAMLRKHGLCKPVSTDNDDADEDAASDQAKALMRKLPIWVREIVIDVASRRYRDISAILGRSLAPSDVAARNEVFYRIKATKPQLSFPAIGAWFGRNHTTLLYAVARHSQASGEPPLTRYDINAVKLTNQRSAYHKRKQDREARQAAR